MTKSNRVALAVGNLELTILGLTFFLNPDYFWNPINGVFKSFTSMTEDMVQVDLDDKIDDGTYYLFMSFGAGLLGIGSMYSLCGHDLLLRKEILKAKLWVTALPACINIHAAFFADLEEGINKQVIAFWGGLNLSNALWVLSDIVRLSKKGRDHVHRTKATPLHMMTLILDMMSTGFWAYCLLLNPGVLEPGKTFSLATATTKDDNTFTDFDIFSMRWAAVPLLAFTLCMLEVAVFDRSVEAIRSNNKFALVCSTFYQINFLCIFFFGSDYYIDKTTTLVNVLVNAFLAIFIFTCGPNVFEPSPVVLYREKVTTKQNHDLTVPDLVIEKSKKVN